VLIFDPLHVGGDLFSMSLAVIAGVFWALAVILAKKLHHRAPNLDLISLTAWQMFFGSLPLVALAFWVDAPPIEWTPRLFAAIGFNAILCNALAWLLWLYALQRLAAGVASMTSMMSPLIGVLAAWIQLGEEPSRSEIMGMALIGVALIMISVHAMKAHEEIEPAMGQD
jgi:drug/metabolite transporter (DMT)-like permease